MHLDALAFLLISLPLFQPLVTRMGYDLIWFGQWSVWSLRLARSRRRSASPLRCRGDVADANAAQVFRGAMRFLPAYLIVFILLLLFPDFMVGWLAGQVK